MDLCTCGAVFFRKGENLDFKKCIKERPMADYEALLVTVPTHFAINVAFCNNCHIL